MYVIYYVTERSSREPIKRAGYRIMHFMLVEVHSRRVAPLVLSRIGGLGRNWGGWWSMGRTWLRYFGRRKESWARGGVARTMRILKIGIRCDEPGTLSNKWLRGTGPFASRRRWRKSIRKRRKYARWQMSTNARQRNLPYSYTSLRYRWKGFRIPRGIQRIPRGRVSRPQQLVARMDLEAAAGETDFLVYRLQ